MTDKATAGTKQPSKKAVAEKAVAKKTAKASAKRPAAKKPSAASAADDGGGKGESAKTMFESDAIRDEISRIEAQGKAKVKQLKDLEEAGELLNEVLSRGFLPLYVLHLVSEQPRHGNDIIHEITIRTEGLWEPSSGGVYSLLKKLEKRGWVEGEWEEGETRAKKTYSLTPDGQAILAALLEIVPPRVAQTHRALELVAVDLLSNPLGA